MSTRVAAIAIVLLSACHSGPKYTPIGGPAATKLNVSGVYDVKETLYSTTCLGYGLQNHRALVEHSPGAASFKITVEDRPYDGTVRADGSFSIIPSTLPRTQGTVTTTITGKFSDSGFYARVYIKEQFAKLCEYQLRWEGVRQ